MKITEARQREALASPVRLEFLEHLAAIGPAPVRDLSGRMERSTHTLHYHARLLEEAGLIRRVGAAKRGPRDEALFDVVADRYAIDRHRERGRENPAVAQTVRAALRMAEREFAEALAGDPDRVDREGCFAGRLKARLSSQGRREIANHLAGIQRVFAQELRRKHPPQARLKTCTLTAVYLYSPRDAED